MSMVSERVLKKERGNGYKEKEEEHSTKATPTGFPSKTQP